MSIARGVGRIEFETPCVSCLQPVVFIKGDYADTFGRLYSTEGLKAFTRDGLCELCGDYLADFQAMNTREGW